MVSDAADGDRHARTGQLEIGGHRTWFAVDGPAPERPADPGRPAPVVLLHGGPGAPHDYLDAMTALTRDGRATVVYDQVGCGRSTRLPDAPAESWTVDLFLDELDAVLDGLGVAGGYHLLGQSWGGMLALEHAVRRPAGLLSLVVADSPPSMTLWVQEANRLRAELPPDVQEALTRHETAGTVEDPEYLAATEVFYDRHVCRVQPLPPEVARSFAALDADPTVYRAMNGPTEFHVVGSLRDWSILDRLGQVAVPTLVVSGRHDEATPAVVGPLVDGLPDARWVVFEDSSHLPHVEETARFLDVVGGFLAEHDQRPVAG